MTINMGDTERMFRILIGLLFIGLAFALGGGWWFGLLGAIPVLTGLVGSCPVYMPFRLSTN